MSYQYFSHNGQILPVDQANVPLSSVEYSYGYGVYETIRATKGRAQYVEDHCARLLESAKIIGIEHNLTADSIKSIITELLKQNEVDACNLKILLIGGQTPESADLYMLCLNPLYPDRKLYKDGAHCVTQHYQRPFPHAKSLNMLQSFLAYKEAKKAGAYDALAVNNDGNITEGTRTNFFAIKDRSIISPPSDEVLLGVTRDHVLKAAMQAGFELSEQDIPADQLANYDGFFLTSTSSKIMPISSIDDQTFEIPEALRELMQAYDEFIRN